MDIARWFFQYSQIVKFAVALICLAAAVEVFAQNKEDSYLRRPISSAAKVTARNQCNQLSRCKSKTCGRKVRKGKCERKERNRRQIRSVYTQILPPHGETPSSSTKGDMNCDGMIDYGDVNPLILALSDVDEYRKRYPNCDSSNGDMNGDGALNFKDIQLFTELLHSMLPLPPSDLRAFDITKISVTLNWNDNSINEVGFEIERTEGHVVTKALVPRDTESFIDRGLKSDTEYRYKVRAYNGVGYSAFSNTVSVKTLPDSMQDMTTASRVSGVAPLGVFFTAADEKWQSGVVQPVDKDYGSFNYEWDFGDSTAGNWTRGRRNSDGSYPSKNRATGFIAAHVYDNPGIYSARLTVTDQDGVTYEYEQSIEVLSEPQDGWITYYVSSTDPNRSDSGPGTMNQPFATLGKAFTKTGSPNIRIRFKAGDTFLTDCSNDENTMQAGVGPLMLDSYGTGARPIITQTCLWSTINSNYKKDVRYKNLDFRNGYGAQGMKAIDLIGPDSLISHCSASGNYQNAFGVDHSGVIFAENEAFGQNVYNSFVYDTVDRLAFLGNYFTDSITHNIRTYGSSVVFSNNIFRNSGLLRQGTRPLINIRTPDRGVNLISISDNLLKSDHPEIGAVMVALSEDARGVFPRNVTIQRNVFDARGNSETLNSVAISTNGADNVTIQNNIFVDLDVPIEVGSNLNTGSWNNWNIYNNTAFSDASGARWTKFLEIYDSPTSGVSDWKVANNIALFPSASDVASYILSIHDENDLSEIQFGHNLYYMPQRPRPFSVGRGQNTFAEWQELGQDRDSFYENPLMIAPPFDFRLLPESTGVDSGVQSSYVRDDFEMQIRPLDGNSSGTAEYDIGAFELH